MAGPFFVSKVRFRVRECDSGRTSPLALHVSLERLDCGGQVQHVNTESFLHLSCGQTLGQDAAIAISD